jgi:hypothetical protein
MMYAGSLKMGGFGDATLSADNKRMAKTNRGTS